jgi:hypothetical protein
MILQNKPTTLSINTPQTVTLNVSELSSSISGTVSAYESNSANWKVVEFIYKNDTQIKRLIFRLNKSLEDYSLTFNEYSLLGNFECVKIRIEDYQADSVVIKRDQFASLFGSVALFDIEAVDEPVDVTPPTILSYQAPNVGTYTVGDNFDYDFTFSEPVIVQGTPSVTIYNTTDLTNYLTVSYVSGSGTNVLKFRYTIESTLTPKTDIVVRPLSPIQLNGGSIRDADGNNSQLIFDSILLGNFTFNDNLNSSITQISSITPSPVLPTYGFNVRVVYQPEITITNPSNLKLNIVIGSTNKVMDYGSHVNITAGITEISFDYIVQSGDLDTDGVVVTSLDLNGATIVNQFSGNAANNSFTAVNTNVNIGTPPTPPPSVWTTRTTPAGAWNKVIYGLDKFVVVGTNDTMMYSSDGITWSSGSFTDPVLPGANWRGVCYSAALNKYVAVASTGTQRVATSTDGITWTLQNAAQANDWVSVAYGAGVFSAVSATSGTRIMYSSDGVTWSNSGVTTGSVALGTAYHITFQNSYFLISRQNSSFNESRIIRSSNGINFSNGLIQSGSQNPITTEVIYGSSHFIGVANTGAVRRSPDTFSWATTAFPLQGTGTANIFQGLTYGTHSATSYYFAVSSNRSISQVIYSTDQGLTWGTFTSITSTSSPGWVSVAFANGIIVAVNNGTLPTTTQRVRTYSFT